MCMPYLHTRTSCLLLVLCLGVALAGAGCSSAGGTSTKTITPPEGLQNVNGTQLYYQAMGKGPPIFFLHGSGGSHHYFLPHLAPLADEYQLLFYDQRGMGLSDGRLDLSAISIDQFVEDIEALRVAFGFEKISLMGHSWGTIIALFYAFKYQAHLDKLILVDPLPVANTFMAELDQTMEQRFERLSPEEQHTRSTTCRQSSIALNKEALAECYKIDAAMRFYDPAKELTMDATVDKNTARNGSTVYSLLMTSFERKKGEIDADLTTMHVPTLIIHGDYDPIPIAASAYLQQRLLAAQLVVIKQSGHFPFVEQPEAFLAAVRAFMRT